MSYINYLKKILLGTLLLLLSVSAFADGSANLYPSGVSGKRAFLQSRDSSIIQLFDLFPTMGLMRVYVKAGETIYVGSSAQGYLSGTIRLYSPNGNIYTSGNSTSIGRITNRTQELAGPYYSSSIRSTGYTPYTRVVGTTEEGIWAIKFVPPGVGTNGTDVDANAAWSQGTASTTGIIAAFDVSVGSSSNASTLIPGRVYCNTFNANMSQANGTAYGFYGTFYALTNVGYTYLVKMNGQNGASFNFFVNNKGIQSSSTGSQNPTVSTPKSWYNGDPSYLSVSYADQTVQTYIYDPRLPDNGTEDITHKLFFTVPATDMPDSASIRYDIPAVSKKTWLRKIQTTMPVMTGLAVVGVESGTNGVIGPDGSYVSFTSSVSGSYNIELTFSQSGTTKRVLTGDCVSGANKVLWDGYDGSSTPVKITSGANISVSGKIIAGEMHFPLCDVEINPQGMIVELLKSDYSSYANKKDTVYWNDNGLTGTTPPSPLTNTTGLSGTLNGHKWGAYTGTTLKTEYGDQKILDTWTYAKGDVVTTSTTAVVKKLDLAVNSVTPSVTSTTVGNTITYTVVVKNIYNATSGATSDAVGATFGLEFPSGFTITGHSTTTNSGTFSETSFSTAGTLFSSVFSLTSGGQATYIITGTVGSALAHGTITPRVWVIRPGDITDIDATSSVTGTPSDPDIECNGGASGVGCNNIVTSATTTITNLSPSAADDTGSVNENATVTVTAANGVLNNDTDADVDALTVTAIRSGSESGSGTSGTVASPLTGTYGTLTLNADGSYTYVADQAAANALKAGATATDVFTYTISDGNGGTDKAQLTITVTGLNDIPTVSNITKSGNEDIAISFTASDFTNKFSDPDADALTQVKVIDLPSNGTLKLNGVTIAAGQVISATDLVNITFTPNPNWNGTTSFNWNGYDGTSYAAANASVNITVNAVNDPPTTVGDVNTTYINTPVRGNVLTNDSDPEGNTLTVTAQTNAATGHGTVTVNTDGTYTYTPNSGYTGEDTFTYQVCDNGTPSACSSSTVTVEVMPTPGTGNNPPVAVNDYLQGSINTTVNGKVLANDMDPDENSLTVSSAMVDTDGDGLADDALTLGNSTTVYGTNAAGSVVSAGTFTLTTAGVLTFTPNSGFVGTVPFNYMANDGTTTDDAGGSIRIEANPSNTNTTFAMDDAFTATQGSTLSGDILTNDNDPQGNTQNVSGGVADTDGDGLFDDNLTLGSDVTIYGKNAAGTTVVAGTLTLNSNGNYTFVPKSGFYGTTQFIYQACDNGTPSACDNATVYLGVSKKIFSCIVSNKMTINQFH